VRELIALTAAACLVGSCGDSATGPTPDATVTITSAGVSPKEVHLKAWNQVVFVNNDTQPHTSCPIG
jgi:plastocyanin